ncbi:MAG: hypothetical protein LBF84_03715 [Holosporales bacterium]|jgi:hypothetical protein|nr:hypothetical protein [Holosporales bacterium]
MTDVAPERPSVPEHSLVPSVTPFSRFGISGEKNHEEVAKTGAKGLIFNRHNSTV